MVEHVLDNIRKATESAVQAQQEMFRKWTNYWTGIPLGQTSAVDQVQAFQKKWAEACAELLKKQRDSLEAQFSAGLKAVEEAFRVTDARDPKQFQAKVIEFWQKSFESLGVLAEAQMRDFQAAVVKCAELVSRKVT